MSPAGSSRFTNRLAGEQSPYLRQHAHNPVDWHPWGEEAFARARAEQKPIFLSVGYSTCHWCHVMAHESFENEAIARRLNRDFVPVKVDREERPDVDRIYMAYVQAVTGQGGWPMTVWLTPDLKPVYGGTYFPPEDRGGRAGLATILDALARAWADRRDQLVAEGERVAAALQQLAGGQSPKAQAPNPKSTQNPEPKTQNPEAALLAAAGEASAGCLQQLAQGFDATYGGFGGAPKFPRAAVFDFLFRTAGTGDGTRMAALTLRRMAEGGLHDHVGGGFHRYSVDDEWFVPHFEKMLYDQAQLAVCYLEARQATGDERYAWVARDTLDYVLRDLAHQPGGFLSAEDADSPRPVEGREPGDEGRPVEGAFYIWTKPEIEGALANGAATPSSPADATGASRPQEDAALFCAHFDVRDDGNVPAERDPHGEFRGRNILRQRQPLAETARQFGLDPEAASDRLQACLARLQAVRARRPRPSLDDKIVTAWNGLMISALARAHQVFESSGGARRPAAPNQSVGASAGAETTPGAVHEAGGPAVRPCLNAAIRAAEFLRRELYDEPTGTLFRSYRGGRSGVPGFAEDHACLIQGLLDLYEASFEIRWLQWAERLQAGMDEAFWDAAGGGYFSTRADAPGIIARLKEDYDGAEPAPASVAVSNLLRLDAMIGAPDTPGAPESGHRRRARQCAEALRARWEQVPLALPQLLAALESAREPPRTAVLAGDPTADDFRELAAVLHERARPRLALLAADGGEGQRWLALRRPEFADMKPIGGRAAAYVCENFACRPPVTTTAELRALLA